MKQELEAAQKLHAENIPTVVVEEVKAVETKKNQAPRKTVSVQTDIISEK